jgi:hypothetical protein
VIATVVVVVGAVVVVAEAVVVVVLAVVVVDEEVVVVGAVVVVVGTVVVVEIVVVVLGFPPFPHPALASATIAEKPTARATNKTTNTNVLRFTYFSFLWSHKF